MENHLKYLDYVASVEFSAEDEVFYGKVLGIADLISFEGQSVRELKKAFKEAVDDYLEYCRRKKKNPAKTYKGSFNIRLSAELHRLAAIRASSRHLSLNEYVNHAISYAVTHENEVLR
jgi:predicted HicB family RNase H-like nuclease